MQRLFILKDEAHSQALYAFLRANWKPLAEQGRPLAILVTEHKAKRNNSQNRLLWSLLNQIAEEAWLGGKQYGPEAWHEFFKRKFIGCVDLPDGSMAGISTTTLDVHAFADYVTQIQHYAVSELGVELI